MAGKANSKGMLPNGRSKSGPPFVKALHAIFDHPDYVALKLNQRAFLWDVSRQFNGRNNGNLCCAHGTMKRWGYSKSNCERLANELVEADWLRITRQQVFHKQPRLFALSWLDVDDFDEPRLDPGARSRKPRKLW